MRLPFESPADGTAGKVWPVLGLLLLAVLVPTACVLWFMNEAMRNEEAAIRLRLTEAYRGQLQSAAVGLRDRWRQDEETLSTRHRSLAPPARFAALVQSGLYDAVVVLDGEGAPAYPRAPGPDADVLSQTEGRDWLEARKTEFEDGDALRASRLYARISERAAGAQAGARALLAQARCLVKAKDKHAAVGVLARLAEPRYRAARDEQGRLIAPNALLLALEQSDAPSDEFRSRAERLRQMLVDYDLPWLSSSQRRFLWKRLDALAPAPPAPPVRAGEDLAAAFLEKRTAAALAPGLNRSAIPGVWAWAPKDARLIVLFHEPRLQRQLEERVRESPAPRDMAWQVRPPGATLADSPVGTVSLDAPLNEWELALQGTGPDPFAAAARRRNALRLWTASLVIGGLALIAALAGHSVSRQARLTRLKNDLIATVSHELKTPLSSMRVLLDTLRDGNVRDQQQEREYLELIGRENQRLSGLIENFLTFSRVERRKDAFEVKEVAVPEVIQQALDSIGERLHAPGCRFELSLAEDLPTLEGDLGALVTVLVNLLDNALKYSGTEKHVVLRAYARAGDLCLEVADDGIGFPRRVARRIFERFYQADRDLARSVGGVGLGLSIVRDVVGAHHGTIEVASQPGKGSRFTVCLPARSVERAPQAVPAVGGQAPR